MIHTHLKSIIGREVQTYVKNDMPKEGDTIDNDLEFNSQFIDDIDYVDIYYRSKEDCPFSRGNWIVDIYFTDGEILCFKLPKEMTENQVYKYCNKIIFIKNRN